MQFDNLYNIAGKKICSEMFTSKQLKYHHKIIANPDVYKLQCNECGKKASRKDSLNSHKLKFKGANKFIYI